MKAPQYLALVADMDDLTLERIAADLRDLFFDAITAEIEESKVRCMMLDADQAAIAEYAAGLVGHTLERDANSHYLIPTKYVLLRKRLELLRADLAVLRSRIAA